MSQSNQNEVYQRWMKLHLDVLMPLGRQGKRNALIDRAEAELQGEENPGFRQMLINGVAAILQVNGWEMESLVWRERAISEAPDDPTAQNSLAMHYYVSPLKQPTLAELTTALEHNAVAVEKARVSNQWRRYVLHDRCRIAAAAGRHDLVAKAMAEILEVWKKPCEVDIPAFEDDWLNAMPEDAIDPDLLRRYREVAL